MGTALAMPTNPDNLLYDPLFSSVGAPDTFLFFSQNVATQVEYPPTSPAGPAAPVLRITPTSAAASAGLSGQGGAGPFDVSVHVAFARGAEPTIALTTMAGDSFPLAPLDGADQVHGDRTYRCFSARVAGPLHGQLVLTIEPKGTDPLWLGAPTILSVAGSSTRAYHVATRTEPGDAALRLVRGLGARRFVPGRIKRPRDSVLVTPARF
jgi:hypothetical protein